MTGERTSQSSTRMFAISVAGERLGNEPAGGRTPEELQHHLTHVEGLKNVRVYEWIRKGARGLQLRTRGEVREQE